jgi:hypothetical protein
MRDDREYDAQHGRCSWMDRGNRCRFPGSSSFSTRGDGPWYCVAHLMCSGDQERGSEIVAESRSYTPGSAREARIPVFTYTRPARLPYLDRDDEPELVQAEPGANG